jgi:predicted outer membrane repeat protein
MYFTRLFSRASFLLLVIAGGLLLAHPAAAEDAVVGNGTPGSCTETSFDVALNTVKIAGGTITFDCGGPATITFTGQKYVGPAHVVVDGGEEITLSGGNITRIFSVLSGSLLLRNITLTNGHSGHGGAILAENGAKLIVVNSTIQNSRTDDGYAGGAILSFDTTGGMPAVEIEDSTIQFNESGYAAINTVGHLIVRNSLIQGNRGNIGGGGFSVGGVTQIYDSRILDNEATGQAAGGGILASGTANVTVQRSDILRNTARFGGGIYSGGTVVLIDTTVADNRATYRTGGGLHNIEGAAHVIGTTFSGNASLSGGAAIANDRGELSLENSTLSHNDIVNPSRATVAALYTSTRALRPSTTQHW